MDNFSNGANVRSHSHGNSGKYDPHFGTGLANSARICSFMALVCGEWNWAKSLFSGNASADGG